MTLPLPRLPVRHPRYTYVTADLLTGAVLDELPLGGVSFSRALNDAGGLSGSFAYTARTAALLRPATTPARTALYALRDNQVVWGGIIWTRRVDHDARIVTLGCADWWSYFDHRLIVATADFTLVDQNDIARTLLATAQANVPDNLGITATTGASGRVLTRAFADFNYSTVAAQLAQLAEDEGGPDIRFDTTGSLTDGIQRRMAIGTPRLGRSSAESGHVFDYGAQGAVMTSLVESEDGTLVGTRHYALGPGFEAGKRVGVAQDDALITLGFPTLETTTSYSDDSLDSQAAIDAKARADLASRNGIRSLPAGAAIGFDPADLLPGDEVLLEVTSDWYNDDPSVDTRGIWSLPTRVTAFSVNVPDDGGQERITPTFGDLVITTHTVRHEAAPESRALALGPGASDLGFGDGLFGDGPFGG